MAETRKQKKHRKMVRRKTEDNDIRAHSPEEKKRLKELDEFIEAVLEEAGEEFLDGFKQVEGQ